MLLDKITIFLTFAVASSYYKISLSHNPDMTLIINKGHVGFVDLKYHDISQKSMRIKINDGIIWKDKDYLCKSPKSNKIETCVTDKAVHGYFEKYTIEGNQVIMQQGDKVLAKGDYDPNTDMYSVISVTLGDTDPSNYYLNISEYRDGAILDSDINENEK